MFGWLRPVRRLTWYIFLLTLPFHITPFLNGLFEGILLSKLVKDTYNESLKHFKSNTESAEMLDWFSVPGAPGIHDLGVAPFFVAQLRNPMAWWEKLGLRRFDVDLFDMEAMGVLPVDQLADLDVLYRKLRRHERGKSWHHFVFASAQMIHLDGIFFDEWDQAFDELLRYHYANPTPSSAEFHFISCPDHFLCDIWATRGPALLHFTTDTPDWFDKEHDVPERPHVPGYEPVTARIIEFPIVDTDKLALLPGVFPSPFNQLRSITSDPHIWQEYEPFSKLMQTFERLQDKCDEAEKTYAKTYGRLYRLETWISRKIGCEDELWPGVMRMPPLLLTSVTVQGVEAAWGFLKEQGKSFLGSRDEDLYGEWTDEREEEDVHQASTGRKIDNFMAQMLQDSLDAMPVNVEELAKDNPEAQAALDRMWDVVSRKPAAVDYEEEDDEAFMEDLAEDPNAQAAWDFFDANAEDMEEIMRSANTEDEIADRILELARRKRQGAMEDDDEQRRAQGVDR